jgi:hypothetical protein
MCLVALYNIKEKNMNVHLPTHRIKKLAILVLFVFAGTCVGAQTLDTVRIVSKARKFAPSKHIMLMFELKDTVDVFGKNTTMSRSYYFDEQNRSISYVREYYNPKKPARGTQVIYSFGANKLTAVTVIPPKSMCRNCASQYFYSNDSLSSKLENANIQVNSANFLTQAHYFQAKLPKDLPWGIFDDEIIVNDKRKKIKSPY